VTPNELGSIRTDGKFNADHFVIGCDVVILFQPSANIASLDAHHRVVTGGVADWTLEEIRADDSLFQRFVVLLELIPHHIREELLRAPGSPKESAVKNGIQFLDNSFLFGEDFRAILPTNLVVPDQIGQ
jgi:hypothetical protein